MTSLVKSTKHLRKKKKQNNANLSKIHLKYRRKMEYYLTRFIRGVELLILKSDKM